MCFLNPWVFVCLFFNVFGNTNAGTSLPQLRIGAGIAQSHPRGGFVILVFNQFFVFRGDFFFPRRNQKQLGKKNNKKYKKERKKPQKEAKSVGTGAAFSPHPLLCRSLWENPPPFLPPGEGKRAFGQINPSFTSFLWISVCFSGSVLPYAGERKRKK